MRGERDPSSVQQVLNKDFGECVCISHEWDECKLFLSEWDGINAKIKAFCVWWSVYDELRDIYGLWLCERGKRVFEIRWVWAKDDEWWAWRKLNHEKNSK